MTDIHATLCIPLTLAQPAEMSIDAPLFSSLDEYVGPLNLAIVIALIALVVPNVRAARRSPNGCDDYAKAQSQWMRWPQRTKRIGDFTIFANLIAAIYRGIHVCDQIIIIGGQPDPAMVAATLAAAMKYLYWGLILCGLAYAIAWVFEGLIDRKLVVPCGGDATPT